jgi:tetratricopeptide (TPR) repeat protein
LFAIHDISNKTMWLERRLKRLQNEKHPVVFSSSDEWGVPYLIHALASEEKPLVWLKLDASHANDAIAQGNKLSDALTRALATPLFGYGMHYNYAVALIRNHLPLLGPFTFALSGAEHGVGLARELLTLHGNKNTVILHFESDASFAEPDAAAVFDKDFLQVTEQEAKELSDGYFADQELSNMLQASGGAYELFSIALSEQRSIPVPLRPTPEGLITPPSVEEVTVDPQALIDALINRKRWTEAFEVMVRYAPQRVPEVMEEAGHIYHERGLHKRLWQLLLQLPKDLEPDESILFCKLQAAFRINESESVRKDVEVYLAENEAPRLRALSAGAFFSFETSLENAKRAYQHKKDPLTVCFYGHLLHITKVDTLQAIEVLRESVRLAKENGRGYEIIHNTQRFASALCSVGNYKEAFYYTKLAFDTFYLQNLGDWQRYLELVNNLCYFQLLTDSEKGVLERLKQNETALTEATTSLIMLYQSTLGDYYLATGQPAEALVYYEKSWKHSEPEHTPYSALDMINALLVNQKFSQALRLAEETCVLAKDADVLTRQVAILGYGMALALSEPKKSIEHLEGCCKFFASPPSALYCATASLFLAQAYLKLDDKSKAADVLGAAKPYLSELSQTGLRLLSGHPDVFGKVWEMIQVNSPPLSIRCLGKSEVRLHNKEIPMPLRWFEILILLASNPNGLTGEQLLLLLYGDEGNLVTLKATLSKMRQYIPLSSRIYKLDVDYKADFLEVDTLLEKGEVAKALEIYQGPLLVQSDVPGIVEMREILDEKTRRAVLQSNNHRIFEQYSLTNQDDIEILEGWLRAMPQNHPKSVFVKAKIKQFYVT